MSPIVIDGKELTDEEVKAAVMKAEDYTQKTQRVAAEKEQLDREKQEVEGIKQFLQFAYEVKPEIGEQLDKMVNKEVARMKGQPVEDEEDISTAEEDKPLSKDELRKFKEEAKREALLEMNQLLSQKDIESEMKAEFKDLISKGYTSEEIGKIANYAKTRGIISPKDAVGAMILQDSIPNRLKKEKKEDEGIPPVNLMSGRTGAGLGFEDINKELDKYGGDPKELLRANIGKLYNDSD
jgi:hypothetical protein